MFAASVVQWRNGASIPAFDAAGDADLLLPKLWAALTDHEREHLGRCSVLSEPAPWAAIRQIGPDHAENSGSNNDTAPHLMEAGLLSPVVIPIPPRGQFWWYPHRLVQRFVEKQWTGDPESVNAELGAWYQHAFEESQLRLYAERSVTHLLAADRPNGAWPLAQSILLELRRAGRYREALMWPERILAAGPSGPQRGLALAFQVQLQIRAGKLPADFESHLLEAEKIVETEDRSFVIDQLANCYRVSSRLAEARQCYERSLNVEIDCKGEIHPDVAASLHSLAMIYYAQDESARAIKLLKKVVGIETQLYGAQGHYTTAETEEMLGQILVQAGEVQEGLEMLVRALTVYHEKLGPQHPHTQRLAKLLSSFMGGQDSDEGSQSLTE